jgi:hypothetical protein
MCSFFQRSQMLAAYTSDQASFQLYESRTWNMSVIMEDKNWNLYHSTRQGKLGDYFDNAAYRVFAPVGDAWTQVDTSYFSLISDFARRVRSGSTCTMEEMRDSSWVLKDTSEQKKNVAFVCVFVCVCVCVLVGRQTYVLMG